MKLIRHIVLLAGFIAFSSTCVAQETAGGSQDAAYEQAFIAPGIGLDHGGIGVRIEFLPVRCLGFFAAAGYNLIEPGINAGASLKILPGRRLTPTAVIMYGYNAVIKMKNHTAGMVLHEKTYSGFSAGAGVELVAGKSHRNKINLVMFIPIRNDSFHRDYDNLKEEGYAFASKPLPVAFSLGYGFSITGKLKRK
jgi:hypothetical protein